MYIREGRQRGNKDGAKGNSLFEQVYKRWRSRLNHYPESDYEEVGNQGEKCMRKSKRGRLGHERTLPKGKIMTPNVVR